MKKNDLFSDTGGKNAGLQLGNVLTCQMVYHHKMKAPSFSVMPSTVEESHLAVNNILIRACP